MIYDKIVEIIGDKMDIEVEEISMDSSFESLNIDSLDMVELVMDIEEAFDITVEDSAELTTVSELVKYIENSKKDE